MTIVVGYRPTVEGRAALERALTEQALRHSDLLVLHSSESLQPDGDHSLEQQVDALTERLSPLGAAVRIEVLDPVVDPADAILGAAAETGAELIVLGLRRRTPVGKLLLGSTAQRVLLEAACPVLAVKAAGTQPT